MKARIRCGVTALALAAAAAVPALQAFFAGTIGDVAVYPSALSAAQVAAHYAANAQSH